MKRHSFDLISFFFGVLFVGLGIAYLVPDATAQDRAFWVGVPALIVVGLGVMIGGLLRARPIRPAADLAGDTATESAVGVEQGERRQ